jgi:hypothetical protein
MQRTKQHQLDTAAQKVFQQAIPNEWVSRDQTHADYGFDFEVEVFKDSKSTGIIFKVQLKGTEDLRLLKNQKTISYSFSLDNIKYYLEEVNIPIIIIIVDLKTNIVYWHNPILDTELHNTYQTLKGGSQETLSVHLDAANTLPKDLNVLIYEYLKSLSFIAIKILGTNDQGYFLEAANALKRSPELIDKLQNKVDLLRITEISEFLEAKQLDKAERKVLDLLNSTQASIETKFQAAIFSETIDLSRAVENKQSPEIISAIYSAHADQLTKIATRGPEQLRLFALANSLFYKMKSIVHLEYSLYMNWKLNIDDNDTLWLNGVYQRRIKYIKDINIFYHRFKKILKIALDTEQYLVIPDIIVNMIQGISPYLQRMRDEQLLEGVNIYRAELLEIGQLGIDVCKKVKNYGSLFDIIYSLLLLSDISNTQTVEEEKGNLLKLVSDCDPNVQDSIKQKLESLRDMGIKMSEGKNEIEEEEQIYKAMAKSIGVNLDDEKDPDAKVINIGLKDLNPERILKNCKYLFVTIVSSSFIAEKLKLPTAGFKAIICTKHKFQQEALSLDQIYNGFKTDHCNNCKDVEPIPGDWHWTREWQLAQNEIHKGYLKK